MRITGLKVEKRITPEGIELKFNYKVEKNIFTSIDFDDIFKRKKQEKMVKEKLRQTMLFSIPIQLHFGTDWEIDDSEFDELNDNFEKNKKNFTDDFIWKDLTDSNNKRDNGGE